jgi:hypothetical protein
MPTSHQDGTQTLQAEGNADTLSLLQSQVAPQLAADQVTQAGYQQQLGAIGAETSQANAYATATAGLQGQQLGIGSQQIGLQQLGNQQSQATSQQQQGIELSQYALAMGQYPEQQQEAATAYQNNKTAQVGQQAATGAGNAAGSLQANNTLAQNFGFQNQDIARSQQQAVLGQQSEVAGYNLGQEQYQNAASNLSLMAQSNGLSQQELSDQLSYGIAQNDQSGIQSVGQLLSSMGSLASGDISAENTAVAPIAYASGVNPFAASGAP